MFERFTDAARAAVLGARGHATALDHHWIGTEHLLLGLLATDGSEAVAGLRLAGVDQAELRERLVGALPHCAENPNVTGALPLSPKAQRAVNAALTKAQGAGSPSVSSRMLLVTLLDECETAVRSALRDAGADLDHLHRVLVQDGAIPRED